MSQRGAQLTLAVAAVLALPVLAAAACSGTESNPPPVVGAAPKTLVPNSTAIPAGTPAPAIAPTGDASQRGTPEQPKNPPGQPLSVQVSRPSGTEWVVRVENSGNEWWKSPAGWAPIIALLIAAAGWFLSNLQVGRQLIQQRENQKNQFAIENAHKRAQLIRDKLNSFHRPYKQLSDTNKLLHEVLKRSQTDPEFRTLISLLKGDTFTQNDKALVDEIVKVGGQLEALIAKASGYVDDAQLRRGFAEVAEHFRVLRLASEGRLSGDSDRFKDKVYPRDLDEKLDDRIEALEADLQKIEKSIE